MTYHIEGYEELKNLLTKRELDLIEYSSSLWFRACRRDYRNIIYPEFVKALIEAKER